MSDEERAAFKARVMQGIAHNIATAGQHLYSVGGGGPCPRYSYSIGLSEKTGLELILAGGIRYMGDEVAEILNLLCDRIRQEPATVTTGLELPALGRLTLGAVDPSWSDRMALGALDYYRDRKITFLQVLPEAANRTCDIPDMSLPWSPATAPMWRWLDDDEPWTYSIPRDSTAVTDLAALQGAGVCEIMRWDEESWECFSGPPESRAEEDIRVVPLAVLGTDPGVEALAALEIGCGLFRFSATEEWHPWGEPDE